MFIYHRAFDPNHTIMRILQILSFEKGPLDFSFVEICDFFLLFPQVIGSIRLPVEYRERKRSVGAEENYYKFSGKPRIVFRYMQPIHYIARQVLLSKGLIDQAEVESCKLSLLRPAVPPELALLVEERNRESHNILSFFSELRTTFGLQGREGLKSRSGLLEFRYDQA